MTTDIEFLLNEISDGKTSPSIFKEYESSYRSSAESDVKEVS